MKDKVRETIKVCRNIRDQIKQQTLEGNTDKVKELQSQLKDFQRHCFGTDDLSKPTIEDYAAILFFVTYGEPA